MALCDIFGRKRAVEALVRAKADWEQTFDAVPDLIALLDKDHRITRVNRSMAERLGCTPDQAVGRHCYEALHGLSAPPDFCPHARMLASGKEQHAEVVEERLGGTFDVSVIPLRNQTGGLVGCVHIAHDVTRRKWREQELRESEENFRNLTENTLDGILICTGDGRYIYANRRAAELLGYPMEEMLQTTLKDLADPTEYHKLQQRLQDRIAGRPVPDIYETVIRRKDGTTFPADIMGTRTVWQGRGCGLFIFHDITARKRMEEEITKIATWEKQRIGRDLHDGVAQQLAAVAYLFHGLKNRLYHDMKNSLSQAEAAKMAEIDAALYQSLQQIRQIAHTLLPAGLDEKGLVAALQYLAGSTFQNSGVNCRLEQSGDPVAFDERTSSNLYYLVREAVMNAVRHGSPRTIVVSIAYGVKQLQHAEVQDDGCGFDPSSANKNGMGLQIMRYRADVIGGVLTIDSRPGGGTRIRCEFPV